MPSGPSHPFQRPTSVAALTAAVLTALVVSAGLGRSASTGVATIAAATPPETAPNAAPVGPAAPAAGAAPDAAAKPKRPNVLIILADDLGYSDLGCYGGEIPTPNLDALAAGGLRFTDFYNTARCWPSRAAILTGYYAQQVRRDLVPGISGGTKGTRPAWAPLLPAMLAPLGYRSYHSGKWHIDGEPVRAGFDRSYNLPDGGRYFSPKTHFEDGKRLPAVAPGSGWYSSAAIADHAIKCLDGHAAEHGDKPFFSYVAFTAPHFPLQAPAEDIARHRDRYKSGWEVLRAERAKRQAELGLLKTELSPVEPDIGPPYHFAKDLAILGPGEVNRPLPWDKLTDEQRAFQAAKMAVHAAMVDRMDREIGRILARIKAMGRFEDTLILFASDNGASAEIMVRDDGHDPKAEPGSAATHLCLGPGWSNAANTPFRRHKTWVHEGGIATPLVVHWPAGIKDRGAIRRTPGHLIDVVPTVLEAAGSSVPADRKPPVSGRSLLPALTADVPVKRDGLWWMHEGNRALRVGDWKLVAAKGDDWELYDLSKDRSETRNLAAAHPEKVKELAAEWERRTEEYYGQAREGAAAKK